MSPNLEVCEWNTNTFHPSPLWFLIKINHLVICMASYLIKKHFISVSLCQYTAWFLFPFRHPQIYLQYKHLQAPRQYHKTELLFRIKWSKLLHTPPLFNVKAVSIVHNSWNTEVKVRHPPVKKVEDVCTGPAVELSFDSLRVCVRGELLAGVLSDQKQCVVLRVGDLELVGADWADFLCCCVRVDDQGFGRAASVHFLQGYTEIVLQRETKSPVLTFGSTNRNLHNE